MTIMRRVLLLTLILFVALPGTAIAAFDDVTLTTDVVINVAGIDLNVSGSSAVVESITVNASDFSFTLQSGSSIQVTSPDRRELSTDASSQYVSVNVCDSSQSILKHESSAGGSVVVTVTPQASVCTDPGPSGSTSRRGTRSEQSEPSIGDLLARIAELKAQIAVLTGGGEAGPTCPRFIQNHGFGDVGGEVVDIQAFLRTQGHFTFPTNTGYYGPITEAAVSAFQSANAALILTPLGFTGPTGNWYEATRGQANVLSGCASAPSA